ncbi:MAG: hypothetical protein ABL982_12455 [Vicinamibacterales bacterium]
MNPTSAADQTAGFEPLDHTFTGPRITRHVLAALRRAPVPVTTAVLTGLAVADGVVRRRRLARAYAWAGAQGYHGWGRTRLALALLGNHGRYVAQEAMVGLESEEAVRQGSIVRGAEHLSGPDGGGALLLGVHVGPPRAWLMLRAHGVPVSFAIRETAGQGARWEAWRRDGVVVPLPYGSPESRVQGLYTLRRLLADGRFAFLAADGPFGGELFRLDLPGFAPVIRAGWFTMRRQLRLRTLPVLAHEEGARRIVTIYPPLPAPTGDEVADKVACRAVLTAILGQYVRRYPSQCRYLAFPRWPS